MRGACPPRSSQSSADLPLLTVRSHRCGRYERAARELVRQALAKQEEEHQQEIRMLRLDSESEVTRKEVGAEMRLKALDDQAREEHERLVRARPPLLGDGDRWT